MEHGRNGVDVVRLDNLHRRDRRLSFVRRCGPLELRNLSDRPVLANPKAEGRTFTRVPLMARDGEDRLVLLDLHEVVQECRRVSEGRVDVQIGRSLQQWRDDVESDGSGDGRPVDSHHGSERFFLLDPMMDRFVHPSIEVSLDRRPEVLT